MQMGLVILGETAWLYAPHQILVLMNVKNTGTWNKQKLVLTNKQGLKVELKWIKEYFLFLMC